MSLLSEGLDVLEKGQDVQSYLVAAQQKVDATVALKARNQVQLVRFIYEQLGIDGIVRFYRSQIVPWAQQWAETILRREGLEPGSVNALKAMELYEEVHRHTTICTDSLGFFMSAAHPDYVVCGATHCPAARGWMEIWPEGAHLLCFLYSVGFDTVFFRTLNPELYFTRHAECCAEQPGLPHGRVCVMELKTRGRELSPEEVSAVRIPGAQPEEMRVSDQTTALLEHREIEYVPHVPHAVLETL